MSFKSILSDVGHVFERVLTLGIAGAQAAEPFVDLAYPGVSNLFNSIVQQAALGEAAAATAGKQTGSGAQKLAFVMKSIEGSIAEYEKTAGLTAPIAQDRIEALANAAVAFVNNLPAAEVASK